jgi:IMP dehydrogenase
MKEATRQIRQCMTPDVVIISPEQTVQEAARIMAECDTGIVPVAAADRLVGMITDRDIAVRCIASGKGPETPVAAVMSRDIKYCYDDDVADDVARNMGEVQLRRLVVLDREKRLVGIVALSDLADGDQRAEVIATALTGISRRGPLQQAGA